MLKVLQPDMPKASEMLPFLEAMDASKEYVNGGPFVRQLEAKIGMGRGVQTVAVANGTAAIEQALRSLGLPPDSPVLVPAVTFSGTGLAVLRANLRPLVVDVDPITWQLSVETAEKWLMSGLSPSAPWKRIRAVVPVAAFGVPVDSFAWKDFAEKYGVHVVIDAAGSMTSQPPVSSRHVATCYSLHATKFIGAGEGGIVCTANVDHAGSLRDRICFGFGGTNAKLSEIHAAYALRALEPSRLEGKIFRAGILQGWYSKYMPKRPDLIMPPPLLDRTLMPVLMPSRETANEVIDRLDAAVIETKRWYAPYLNARPDLAPFVGHDDPMLVANMLSARLIGLPFHSFMDETDVKRVCSIVKGALQ